MENQNLKEVVELKARGDMTLDDIKKLPRYSGYITSRKITDRVLQVSTYKNIELVLVLTETCRLKLSSNNYYSRNVDYVSEQEFLLLKKILKKGDSVEALAGLPLPCRFIKGVNKNSNEFYRVDVWLATNIPAKSIWLNRTDVELLKKDNFDMSLFQTFETNLEDDEAETDLLFS